MYASLLIAAVLFSQIATDADTIRPPETQFSPYSLPAPVAEPAEISVPPVLIEGPALDPPLQAAPAMPLSTPGAGVAGARFDPHVRPAGAEAVTSLTDQSHDEGLARSLLPAPAGSESGDSRSLTLVEALASSSERERQRQVIEFYWKVAIDAARCRFAEDEMMTLQHVPAPARPHERALLESAQAITSTELRQCRLSLVSDQYALAALAGFTAGGPVVSALPWPVDAPFTGVYRTRLAEVFQGRVPSSDAQRVDATLPALRDVMESRALCVITCREGLDALLEAYERQAASIRDVLAAHAQLHVQRSEFLSAVQRYNNDIAAYALSVAARGLSRERIVSMLIEYRPPSVRTVTVPQPVTRPAVTRPAVNPQAVARPATALAPVQPTEEPPRLRPVPPGETIPLRPIPLRPIPQSSATPRSTPRSDEASVLKRSR